MSEVLLWINQARFRADIAALAGIGRDENTQILAREIGSDADRAAQLWLQRRIAAAQLAPSTELDETVVAALANSQQARGLVIVGATTSTPSDRPVVGSFALIAGLECLRCLKESGARLKVSLMLALTTGTNPSPSLGFHYADHELLSQAQRLLGLEIRADGTVTMREVCEIAEACGISVLPLPAMTKPAAEDDAERTQTYKFILDEALANWPIENWSALEASANLLLHFLHKFATSPEAAPR